MSVAVELRGIRHSYGETVALDDVSLRVEEGEMFGLVGPDGAGKTTLLRILAGVIEPSKGDVLASSAHRGYLSQGFSLYQDLSVDENIAFFAEIYRVEDYRSRSEELLDFVGLLPFRDRLAGNLSGGMKKKLALACAMVHRPGLLLLDEPTTGVDPVSRRDFWLLLVRLLRERITIVLSTPYLDEAERCMRVGLLQGGHFLAVDSPESVKARLPGFVFEILSPEQRRAYATLLSSGRYAPEELQPFGDRLHVLSSVPDEETASSDLLRVLEGQGIPVSRLRRVAPSLENAFIALVRERGKTS